MAWRAAVLIGTSMLAGSIAKQSIYPQTLFPFEGNTTLIAAGKWLPLGTTPDATFIVYNLRSCSHSFPFRSLRYTASNNPLAPIKTGQPAHDQSIPPHRTSAHNAQDQQLVEQDASNKLKPEHKQVRMEPRFPDLKKKTIWKNKALASADPAIVATAGPAVEQAAIGQPGSEHRIRSIDLTVLSKSDQKRSVPEFLREAVDELMQVRDLNIELLTESEDDGWTVPITVLSNEDGEIDLRLFISDQDGELRLRRTSVFAVRNEYEHISVVFVEALQAQALPLHMKIYTTTGNDIEEIYQTLSCTTGDYLFRPNSEGSNVLNMLNWVFDDNLLMSSERYKFGAMASNL